MDGIEQRHPVHALHAQVGHHHLRARHRERRERGLARLHRRHGVARRRQPHRDQLQQVLVVVDQQHRTAVSVHGFLSAAQLFFALEDTALDRPQRIELLLERLFALVALLVGHARVRCAARARARARRRSSSRATRWRSLTWVESSAAKRPTPGAAASAIGSSSSTARASSRSGGGSVASRVARRSRSAGACRRRTPVCARSSAACLLGERRARRARPPRRAIGVDRPLTGLQRLAARQQRRTHQRENRSCRACAAAARPGSARRAPRRATLILPPCASTNSRAMARPRPLPSTRALACAPAAEERVEDRLALLGRHARPGIDHVDQRLVAARAREHRHVAARGRELHRVADQVVDHGAQLLRVGLHGAPTARRAPGAGPWPAPRARARASLPGISGCRAPRLRPASAAAACSARW